jgi:hypothetical protein
MRRKDDLSQMDVLGMGDFFSVTDHIQALDLADLVLSFSWVEHCVNTANLRDPFLESKDYFHCHHAYDIVHLVLPLLAEGEAGHDKASK